MRPLTRQTAAQRYRSAGSRCSASAVAVRDGTLGAIRVSPPFVYLPTFLMRSLFTFIFAFLLGLPGFAAPVPVNTVSMSGNQLISLTVNGNDYPQAQLALTR